MFEREARAFQRMQPQLVRDHDNDAVAVILGERLVGVFADESSAFREAIAACGLDADFLLRRIDWHDEPATAPALVLGLMGPKAL